MGVDWTKPIQTRDGEAVRDPMFFHTPRGVPKVSLLQGSGEEEFEFCVNVSGRWIETGDEHHWDIVNVATAEATEHIEATA